MRQRIKFWYYETKCWITFHHHMESLGKFGEGRQLYQCSFCFKRIIVNTAGVQKGVHAKTTAQPDTQMPVLDPKFGMPSIRRK